MICPCKGCEKAGCGSYHDVCPAYSEWRAWKDNVNKKKSEEGDKRTLSRDHELKYRKNLKKGWKNT